MSPITPRRVTSALAAASLALPIYALVAAPASAAPDPSVASPSTYEQISRASGPAGATKLDVLHTPMPLWASDLGITAAYNPDGQSNFSLQPALPTTTLRNTATDDTRAFGADRGQLLSADRLEQVGLFQRVEKIDDFTYARKYAVGRIDGHGPLRDVPVSDYATVRLSGNGRFVITSDQNGLRRFDVPTAKWTTISPLGILGRFAVSDDGQTVAGLDFDLEAQRIDAVVWQGTRKLTLEQSYPYGPGGEPVLSPDGSTVFTIHPGGDYPAPTTVTARNLKTGKTTTSNVPFDKVYDARPIWVSPEGDRIAFALNYQDPDAGPLEPAQAWTVGKSWASFGGPFATSLMNDETLSPPSAISRNGKYAAVAYNDQVALVSLSGTPLLGNRLGRDALSATSYFDTPGIDYCGFGFSSEITGSFTRPAYWAPKPRRAHIAVGDGTQILQQADWTNPAPWPHAANVEADFINVHFPVGTPHTRTLDLSVVDGNGRTVREQQAANVTCGSGN